MQLDCVDVAFNRYVCLNLLDIEGKLHWHSISEMVHQRWLVALFYPYTEVSMIELKVSDRFVIDSWVYDNGKTTELIPLQVWKAGWTPEDFKW